MDINDKKKINVKINAVIEWLPLTTPIINKPLTNLHVTVKDVFSVKDTSTTLGVKMFPKQKEDGEIVKKLKSLGAVIVGKTNVPELLLSGFSSSNKLFGDTFNPINISKTPGGSSGGEASAVASGISDIGIGTDFGGSVRIPASFCGLFGFVPREFDMGGITYFPEGIPPGIGLVKNRIGFLSKKIGLIKKVYSLLTTVESKSEKIQIGFFLDTDYYVPCKTTYRIMNQTFKFLRSKYNVKAINFNKLERFNEIYHSILKIQDWKNKVRKNPHFKLEGDYEKEVEQINKCLEEMLNYLGDEEINIIISPTVGFPAPGIEYYVSNNLVTYYTKIYNLLNYAVGSVPIDIVREGENIYPHKTEKLKQVIETGINMPVGLQVAGVNNANVLKIMEELNLLCKLNMKQNKTTKKKRDYKKSNEIRDEKRDEEGYDEEGYDEEGYNEKGYDEGDEEGYDKEGYDKEGDEEDYDEGDEEDYDEGDGEGYDEGYDEGYGDEGNGEGNEEDYEEGEEEEGDEEGDEEGYDEGDEEGDNEEGYYEEGIREIEEGDSSNDAIGENDSDIILDDIYEN